MKSFAWLILELTEKVIDSYLTSYKILLPGNQYSCKVSSIGFSTVRISVMSFHDGGREGSKSPIMISTTFLKYHDLHNIS